MNECVKAIKNNEEQLKNKGKAKKTQPLAILA